MAPLHPFGAFMQMHEVLGGLTRAVVGILTPLVVADCTEGCGCYNVALGASGMFARIGATISTTAVGFIAQYSGFTRAAGAQSLRWAFGVLAVVAAAGMSVLFLFLPETA